MKKFLITGVLCFLVSLSFGQKKAVNAAKNEIKGNTPNFVEARLLIKDALENPETANDAETWFVAGQIENRQFDKEREKEILGSKPNEELMYDALEKIIPYFVKAIELDQLPDIKGKIKPKFLKDIRSIIRANRPFYVNAGIFAYEKSNFKKAYENFKQFGDIPKMDIYKDEKWIIQERDSSEVQIRYYAGLAASQIPDPKAAISIFEEIKNFEYSENEIFQHLAEGYNKIGDSVAYENIIKEGFIKFPSEEYYTVNLINICISSGNFNEAITYLEKAISLNPESAQFYDVLGQIYEEDKNPDEAILYMKKAIEIEPDNIDFLTHIGRVHFNMAVEKRTAADEITNISKSKELQEQSLDFFRLAMPYFEKVFENDANNTSAIYALRSIYYNLISVDPEYDAKYKKMDAIYSIDEE